MPYIMKMINQVIPMQEQTQIDKELKALSSFIGSQHYYNVYGFKATDGVKYVMDNGYYWFISDSLIAAKMKGLTAREEFLSIELRLNGNKADMLITDGNNNELYKQHYSYTDAKRNLKLFLTDGVIMLDSEY